MPQRRNQNIGSNLYLNQRQAELIKELFGNRGYRSGRAIGSALYRTEVCSKAYNSERTISEVIHAVLTGRRPIPYSIIEAIIEFFENDPRLLFLRNQPAFPAGRMKYRSRLDRMAYRGDTMDRVLLSYFDSIRNSYNVLEPQGKHEVLEQLEEVVKILSGKTILAKPKMEV